MMKNEDKKRASEQIANYIQEVLGEFDPNNTDAIDILTDALISYPVKQISGSDYMKHPTTAEDMVCFFLECMSIHVRKSEDRIKGIFTNNNL